jgi:hypothetical protein
LQQTGKDSALDYFDLDYLNAIYAFSLFVGSVFDDVTGEILLPTDPPFAPADKILWTVLERLHDAGVLQFGKKTPLNAFDPGQDNSTFTYYFARVSWRFALPEFCESYSSLHSELADRIDTAQEEDDHLRAVTEIWWQIGRSEGFRYLNVELEKYSLSIDEGSKLSDAIDYALTKFSIPQ